jgi:sugar lactone lactonase YvrE
VSIPTQTAELAVDSRCEHGECIVWDERRQALLWTDVHGRRLWLHEPASGRTRQWQLPDRLGCFALCESGRLLLALAQQLCYADIDGPGDEPVLQMLTPVDAQLPTVRTNDGRADRAGNFVFGTLNEAPDRAPIGSYYQYSARHGLRRLALGGVAIPNSICFSPDGGTLYWCETLDRRILCADYDAARAAVSAPRLFARVDAPAGADGSLIDAEGRLWNAQWGAARVVRYDARGAIEREVRVAPTLASCPAFGGAQLSDLYIATSREGFSAADIEREPTAGSVYRATVAGLRGLPESRFEDRA